MQQRRHFDHLKDLKRQWEDDNANEITIMIIEMIIMTWDDSTYQPYENSSRIIIVT